MITQEELQRKLSYSAETGVFLWRNSFCAIRAGDVAGCVNQCGYRQIRLGDKTYKAHRLAWLYVNGDWPKGQIDHINGDRSDNRVTNLRDVSGLVNSQNRRRPQKNNKSSGLLGAHKSKKRWASFIGINGKARRIGLFDTPEEAHEAYLTAKRQLHEGCTI